MFHFTITRYFGDEVGKESNYLLWPLNATQRNCGMWAFEGASKVIWGEKTTGGVRTTASFTKPGQSQPWTPGLPDSQTHVLRLPCTAQPKGDQAGTSFLASSLHHGTVLWGKKNTGLQLTWLTMGLSSSAYLPCHVGQLLTCLNYISSSARICEWLIGFPIMKYQQGSGEPKMNWKCGDGRVSKKKKLYLLAAEDLLGLVDLLVTEETENCRWRIIKRLNIYLSS